MTGRDAMVLPEESAQQAKQHLMEQTEKLAQAEAVMADLRAAHAALPAEWRGA